MGLAVVTGVCVCNCVVVGALVGVDVVAGALVGIDVVVGTAPGAVLGVPVVPSEVPGDSDGALEEPPPTRATGACVFPVWLTNLEGADDGAALVGRCRNVGLVGLVGMCAVGLRVGEALVGESVAPTLVGAAERGRRVGEVDVGAFVVGDLVWMVGEAVGWGVGDSVCHLSGKHVCGYSGEVTATSRSARDKACATSG